MSKDKKKNRQKQPAENTQELIGISKRGKKIIAGGIGILMLGFYILSKTDPAGQNWASILSPFLILGGYAVIAIGIIFPAKGEQTSHPQSEQRND
ncbi:MAG: hypothetical protein ABII23_01745 [bacterium]